MRRTARRQPLTNPAEDVSLRRRRVFGRRPRRVRDDRQGQRVPAARLHRPGDEAADAARDGPQMGRGRLRPVAGRQDARVVGQRGRRFEAVSVRHRGAPAAGPSPARRTACSARWRGTATTASWRFSMASARSTSDVYSLDATSGAVARWTESELGGLVASDLSEPELIRWKSFDGLEISGFYYQRAGALHRQAPGDHQHPRRARGAGAAGVHRPQQLLPQRAGRRDHLSQRARLDRLRQDVRRPRQRHEARGLGEGHRRAARLDRHTAGARCRRG